MKIYRTKEGYYTFKKDKYKSADAIKALYKRKLDIPVEEQVEGLSEKIKNDYVLNGDHFGLYLQIERMAKCDPRYPTIFFKSKEGAREGQILAEKLHKMSDKEFLYSGVLFTYLTGQIVVRNPDGSPLKHSKQNKTLFREPLKTQNPTKFPLPISSFKKLVLISLVVFIVIIAGFIHLKQYRLSYCQTKYSISEKKMRASKTTLRQECLEKPLSEYLLDK